MKQGEKAEGQQDFDGALTFYEQAVQEDSHEPAYLLAVNRVRSKASEAHLAQGRKLQTQQKLDAALIQFQKALMTDPSSAIALQMVMQTNEMIKQKENAPDGTVILTPAERARRDAEERISSLQGPPVLRPINNQISNLKMNNQPARVIFESIGKLAGINVLFDPAGIDTLGATTRNFNLDLNNATLEEALQYVAIITHTFWKPISRNAIFVTQDSEQKRGEYQDEVVKVFYIQNASTAAEFTEIYNGLRIGAKLPTGLFQVASQNAIIARGSPDAIALIEKLVHDLDRAKAEVLVDVRVWEVSKSITSQIGMALQNGASGSLFSLTPGTTTTTTTTGGTGTTTGTTGTTGTGTTTTTNGGSIVASQIGKLSINQFSLALPGAVAQAMAGNSSTRLLDNPQVRVTDGGKGSMKVGEKVPYVSGSLNSAVATPGSIPYATTQFQQIDVGINIDISAVHVNAPNDITMHIKIDISTLLAPTVIAGVSEPTIAQKVNEADVRMKDGEYSLLGGLSSDSDQVTYSGLPGFSAVPVLGYLLGTKNKDREKDDIVIAIVPHIIRAQPIDSQSPNGVLAGTEKVNRVERVRPPDDPSLPAAIPAAAPATTPAAAPPAVTAPAPPPAAPPVRQGGPTPQLPPPGGSAQLLLPPTNNPRLSSAPAGVTAAPRPANSAAPPSNLPPGTEVTPLEGMREMGLTPDPAPASNAGGSASDSSASNAAVAPRATLASTTQSAKPAASATNKTGSSSAVQLIEGHLTQSSGAAQNTPQSPDQTATPPK